MRTVSSRRKLRTHGRNSHTDFTRHSSMWKMSNTAGHSGQRAKTAIKALNRLEAGAGKSADWERTILPRTLEQ